jgi:hypothetical protein
MESAIVLLIFRVNLLVLFLGALSQGALGVCFALDYKNGNLIFYSLGIGATLCSFTVFSIVPWFDCLEDLGTDSNTRINGRIDSADIEESKPLNTAGYRFSRHHPFTPSV